MPPKEWSPGVYEDEIEGSITFEGSLAGGDHSLRLAHRIKMKFPDSPLRIDAQAVEGNLSGRFLPKTVEPSAGKASWNGSVGVDPKAFLRVRLEDGPIDLSNKP